MGIRKIIQRRVERRESGLDLQAHVHAVIAGSSGAGAAWTHVSSHQSASTTSGKPDGAVKVPLRTEVMTQWTASRMGGMRNPTG